MLSICSCFDSCIAHVEHAGQDHAATEVGEAEEQYLDTDFANPDLQQGKPRFIFKPSVTTLSLSPTITTLFMH